MEERSEKTAAKKSPPTKSPAKRSNPKGDGEAKSPEQIEAEIDATHEEPGDTAKAKQGDFATRAQEATPEAANRAAQQAAQTIQANPLPTAVAGSFAAGFLLGWLLGRR